MPKPPPAWHAIMAAQERDPGIWVMVDELGWEYGHIAILRRHGAVCYRTRFRTEDNQIVLLGYATSLRSACEKVHQTFLASHTSSGPIGFESPEQYARRTSARA